MKKYEVRRLNASEHCEWDKFVEQSPGGTIFHTSEWLSLLGEFYVVGCFDKDGELVAGMPCFIRRKLLLKVLVNPTLTPYGGVVFREIGGKRVNRNSTRKKITREILEEVIKCDKNIFILLHPQERDVQPYIWSGFKAFVRYTYLLELDNLSRIEGGMDDAIRRGIKKAVKDGLIVEETDDFNLFFTLVEKTFDRQRKKAYFRECAEKIDRMWSGKNRRRIFITMREGTPVGGVYIIFDSKRAHYLMGGYSQKDGHYGASALAMWTAIKYAKEELGLSEFDFNGSNIPQIERFFRQFGGELTPFYHVERGALQGFARFLKRNMIMLKSIL